MTELTVPADAGPAKADPETLVMRASPARVTRFRRGVIILIAGVSATALAALGWMALKPVSLGLVAPDEDRGSLAAKAPVDALSGAPASYGDVPHLGPPLPGDLGGPILNHSRDLGMDGGPSGPDRADEERQRQEAEARAANQSPIMMSLSGNAKDGDESGATNVAADLKDAQSGDAAGSSPTTIDSDVNAHRLAGPASPYLLSAGTVIAASLITGLNSDLPGIVTAQVTENVFDSLAGRSLLIPQGARLIGRYDNRIAFGQSRALVVWNRLILPDGASIALDDAPASDTEGYAGLADRVDAHGWQLLKGVALSTLIGVGTELGAGDDESELMRAIRESAQQSTARAGDRLVTKSLDVQPTIRVRPGWPVRVLVHKDLVLRPWLMSGKSR